MVAMENILKLLEKDRFAKCNGIVIKEFYQGYAVAEMVVDDHHLNGAGVVQGGALFTLADLCFAAACNSYGDLAVSLDANINYIKGVSTGILTATATEVYRRRTVALYRVEITNEENDLIAVFQSTAYIKRQKIDIVAPPKKE